LALSRKGEKVRERDGEAANLGSDQFKPEKWKRHVARTWEINFS
jgi:hypothetical protein